MLAGQRLKLLRDLLHGDRDAVLDGADRHLDRLADIEHGVSVSGGTHLRQLVNIDFVIGSLHVIRSRYPAASAPLGRAFARTVSSIDDWVSSVMSCFSLS